MGQKAVTIYCDCGYYDLARAEVKSAVLDALKSSGVEFEAVADLCQLCAEGDSRVKEWAEADSLRIFACYPRAVKWLFHSAGAPLPGKGVEFINMRTGDVEKIVSSLREEGSAESVQREVQLEKTGDWIPWFPVIDYGRCEQCKQCFGFCLFGVYEVCDDGRVEVRNPANCKTNCPACAKACPHSAIIFPKYGEGPINGDEFDAVEDEGKADTQGTSLADILDGDIYDTIRKRRKRFSGDAHKGPSIMKELREKLDVPAEVLASLSPAEMAGIKKRAEKKGGNAKRSDDERGESEDDE